VKDEPEEASVRRSRNGGGDVVIRERRRRPRREWTPLPEYKAAASIVKAEDDLEEFPGLRQA
jgi:ribosomal protein S1